MVVVDSLMFSLCKSTKQDLFSRICRRHNRSGQSQLAQIQEIDSIFSDFRCGVPLFIVILVIY